MIYRKPLLKWRGLRWAIEVVAGIGKALLFSYLILQMRW